MNRRGRPGGSVRAGYRPSGLSDLVDDRERQARSTLAYAVVPPVVLGAAAVVATHLLLGGWLWSGGALLWGSVATVTAVLVLGRRQAALMAGACLVAAVMLTPWESTLRASRDQPPLALSLLVIAIVFALDVAVVAPGVAVLAARLEQEHRRSRALLLNVLPASVLRRLRQGPAVVATRHDDCTIRRRRRPEAARNSPTAATVVPSSPATAAASGGRTNTVDCTANRARNNVGPAAARGSQTVGDIGHVMSLTSPGGVHVPRQRAQARRANSAAAAARAAFPDTPILL